MSELLDPLPESLYPTYFKIFEGEMISANQVRREHPYLNIAIQNMVRRGDVIGQRSFLNQEVELESDVLYFMPGRISDE